MKKRMMTIAWILALAVMLTACAGRGSGSPENTAGNAGGVSADQGTAGGGDAGNQEGTGGETPAPVRVSPLDAVFDSGDPKLVAAEGVSPVITAADFEITEELKAYVAENKITEDLEAYISEMLADVEFSLFSRSPSGNSGIVAGKRAAAAMYNGKYHVLFPSAHRGVEDTRGKLKYYMNCLYSAIDNLAGEQNVVYSPDGRYAAIFNATRYAKDHRFDMDPVLLDLATGEAILTATYGVGGEGDSERATVTAAAFSADGKYFWYDMAGSFPIGFNHLYRYDIAAGTTELCAASDLQMFWPNLSELRDGSMMLLNDEGDLSRQDSLVVAAQKGSAWSIRVHGLQGRGYLKSPFVLYSADSGFAILPEGMQRAYYAFHLLEPDQDFDGLNRVLCVSKETGEIVPLPFEEFLAAFEEATGGVPDRVAPSFPYQTIRDMALSPDGQYLLLSVIIPRTADSDAVLRLLLVRLSDLSVRTVSGLTDAELDSLIFRRPEQLRIEWREEGLLVRSKAWSALYTFAAGTGADDSTEN